MIDFFRRYLSDPWRANGTVAFLSLAVLVIGLDATGHIEAGWIVSTAGPFVLVGGLVVVFILRRLWQR